MNTQVPFEQISPEVRLRHEVGWREWCWARCKWWHVSTVAERYFGNVQQVARYAA